MSLAEAPCHDVGYWSRDAVVAMDDRALAKMMAVHPAMARKVMPPELRESVIAFVTEQWRPPFTPESAERILAQLFDALPRLEDGSEPGLSPKLDVSRARVIKRTVAVEHGLTKTDIESSGRSRRIAYVRQKAFYRIAAETTLSFPAIGKLFNRDHTTVIHGVRAYAERHGLPLPRGLGFKIKKRPALD